MPTVTFETVLKPFLEPNAHSNVFEFVLHGNEFRELENWCITNCFGRWKWLEWIKPDINCPGYVTYRQVFFKDVEDAMAFKLRWM